MDFAQQQRGPSRHLVGFSMVIAMHVVLVYGLLTGLGKNVVEIVKQPFDTKIIEDVKKLPPPEPPPQQKLLPPPPPPFVPLPDLIIGDLAPAGPTITAAPAAVPPPPKAPVEQISSQITPAIIDPTHACQQPEYPSLSLKRDEEGSVTLLMLVDVDGRVRESKVQQSSGHDRLDRAARDALTQCHFKARIVDGKPEPSWHQFRFVWRIK